MLRIAINYFAQRQPAELAEFSWTIDRKDRNLTEMERLWTQLILPIGEAESVNRPFDRVEGFDYSHFDKYEILESSADESMKSHIQWMKSTILHGQLQQSDMSCINAKKILNEQRAFGNSRDNLGLQLADITASTLSRALNGHLERSAWEGVGRLLIHKPGVSPFIRLGRAATLSHVHDLQATAVWKVLSANSKSMLA